MGEAAKASTSFPAEPDSKVGSSAKIDPKNYDVHELVSKRLLQQISKSNLIYPQAILNMVIELF